MVVSLAFLTKLLALKVIGVLKGYDQLLNLVLDDVEETIQGMILTTLDRRFCSLISSWLILEPEPHTRNLGLVVLRGPTITIISPTDGSAEIENPFVGAAE